MARTLAQQYMDLYKPNEYGQVVIDQSRNPFFTQSPITNNPFMGEGAEQQYKYSVRKAPAGTTFRSVMEDIQKNIKDPRQQLGLMENLYKQGYFNQFSDYGKQQNNMVGQSIASGQAAFDDEIFGGLDSNDLSMIGMAAAPIAGMYATGSGIFGPGAGGAEILGGEAVNTLMGGASGDAFAEAGALTAEGGLPNAGMDMGMFGDFGNPYTMGTQAAGSAPMGGGSWLDFFQPSAANAPAGAGSAMNNPLVGGLTGKDLLMTGGNFLINKYLADRSHQQAQDMMQGANPLDDPRRKPYQNAALQMVQNPNQYFQNNPFATSLANHYKNSVIPAQFAKSGNAGEVVDRVGSQFATATSQNYNQLLQNLMGYGGFGMPNPGVQAGYGLMNQGNQFNAEAFRGFGDSAEKIFGNPQNPRGQPPTNPITGSTTYFAQ